MQRTEHLTAIIEREDDGYVALCPELDIASQGDSVESASSNLREALSLFFETASPSEVKERFHKEVYVTHFDLKVG
jgi:predicted RNase H-like HicB family nuclease